MNAAWAVLAALLSGGGGGCGASRCSPTSYYNDCWIRRFPGVLVDVEASQRRGAQLLRSYREDAALTCSRACCLTRNFSCNLAIFHFDTTRENCLHLRCPSLESCAPGQRGHAVLYNVTRGVDPDLLVFGKYLTSNVRVLPHHYGRVNASEPLPPDKRHFLHPLPPAASPPTPAPTARPPGTTGASLAAAATTTSPATASSPAASSPPAAEEHHSQTSQAASDGAAPTSSFTAPPPSTTPGPPSGPQTSPTSPVSPHRHTTVSPSTRTHGVVTESSSSSSSSSASVGRNHTADGEGDQGGGGEAGPGPGWHVAARTLLAAAVVCVAVLLSCCCSVLLVVGWRGQRKRMGRYRTSRRRKGGSTRLLKYVLVRERCRDPA